MHTFSQDVNHPSIFADRSGSVNVMFAMGVAVLLATIGVAVDTGRAVSTRIDMQAALDSAVLAAASSASASTNSIANAVFRQNFKPAPGQSAFAFAYKDASGKVRGVALSSIATTLTRLLGYDQITQVVISTARKTSSGTVGKACVIALDKTASQAFLVNSGAVVNAPDCEIHVHSTANPAAIFNAASKINTARVCIAGTQIIDNGGVHPNVVTGCAPAADPYAGKLPTPSDSTCTHSNLNFNGGTVNLNPGVYCGWHNFNGAPTVNFAPGVYVIKNGGWNVNGGNWYGSGVTFYYADTSKIQFNSAVYADIAAPTTGSYAGIFMFEKPGLSRSHFVLNDSRGFNVGDLIYLPSRDVIFNSASNLEAKRFTFIVNTFILDDTNWKLTPGDKAAPAGTSSTIAVLDAD